MNLYEFAKETVVLTAFWFIVFMGIWGVGFWLNKLRRTIRRLIRNGRKSKTNKE